MKVRNVGFQTMLSWAKIGVIGTVFSLVCLISGIVHLVKSPDVWSVLVVAVSVLFGVLYIILANMCAVQTFMYYAWKDNFETTLTPKIERYISGRLDGSGKANRALSKAQMLKDLSENKDSGFFKRMALKALINSLNLDKVDFSKPSTAVAGVVVEQIKSRLSLSEPPGVVLYIVLLFIQLTLLIIMFVKG